MPPQSAFEAKKQNILQDLNRPDDQYTDLSPIGAVDPQIRSLVDEINAIHGFVTTSSCAGRVAVFLEGEKKAKSPADDALGEAGQGISASTGQGKGGGRWLYVSHDPVSLEAMDDDGSVLEMLGLPKDDEEYYSASGDSTRFVHLKFEPMILHIATASPAHAQKCFSAAMAAGFRESGIAGITSTSEAEATPHVAIRTQGLALDCIIGFLSGSTSSQPDGKINMMVSEYYLRTIIRVANDRFRANEDRKERFRKHLTQSLQGGAEPTKTGDQGEWESAEARRERKRAEGLKRKHEMENGDADGRSGGRKEDDSSDALDGGLLQEDDEMQS